MSLRSGFVRRVIAPLWARKERSDYVALAGRLVRRERMDPQERRDLQWEALKSMVERAASVPFYAARFREAGFAPGDLGTWDDFAALPILTKTDIRTHAAELRATDVPGSAVRRRSTSGSTGVPLELVVDRDSVQAKRGVTLYRDEWTGWRLGEGRVVLWGEPPPRRTLRARLRNGILERQIEGDTLNLDRSALLALTRRMQRERPTLIYGHAHSLYLVARFCAEQDLVPSGLRAALSTAMVLSDRERAGIESAFGVPVFDRYGCEELSLIASECEAHEGLHLNTDTLVPEIVPAAGLEGEGRVVVTDLTNRAMPILRYEVGDLATKRGGLCPCGRTYPRWSRIAGRVADYLVTPDGRYVSGISLTDHFATLIPGVQQVQLVQEARDHLTVRAVVTGVFDETSREAVTRLVRERFGEDMRHTVEPVERIDPEPSGKHRFAIRRIPGEDASTL